MINSMAKKLDQIRAQKQTTSFKYIPSRTRQIDK